MATANVPRHRTRRHSTRLTRPSNWGHDFLTTLRENSHSRHSPAPSSKQHLCRPHGCILFAFVSESELAFAFPAQSPASHRQKLAQAQLTSKANCIQNSARSRRALRSLRQSLSHENQKSRRSFPRRPLVNTYSTSPGGDIAAYLPAMYFTRSTQRLL
jgi:hypothetical protein